MPAYHPYLALVLDAQPAPDPPGYVKPPTSCHPLMLQLVASYDIDYIIIIARRITRYIKIRLEYRIPIAYLLHT